MIESHAHYVKGNKLTPVLLKSDATYNPEDQQFYFLVANRTDGSLFTVRAEDVVLEQNALDFDDLESEPSNENLQDIFQEMTKLDS